MRRPAVDKRTRINYQIRASQVRLIDEDGAQLGIKPINDAINLAQEKGKDLVEIAPNANPPVCKILEFSKFRYKEEKKAKDARKKQKGGQIKEVRIRPRISDHDLEIKLKHAKEFLEDHNKVQISIIFMGRENQHIDLGMALMEKVKTYLSDIGETASNASRLGNRLVLSFIPRKQKPLSKHTSPDQSN